MFFSTSVPMLISRQFDDEVVLANYASGIYYNLDGTGAQIWLGIRAGRSVEQIVDGLFAVAKAERSVIDGQVKTFVDLLLKEGIIVAGAPTHSSSDWSPAVPSELAPPRIERFDDLRDLLLMDPIHDVGENGWPLRGGDGS